MAAYAFFRLMDQRYGRVSTTITTNFGGAVRRRSPATCDTSLQFSYKGTKSANQTRQHVRHRLALLAHMEDIAVAGVIVLFMQIDTVISEMVRPNNDLRRQFAWTAP